MTPHGFRRAAVASALVALIAAFALGPAGAMGAVVAVVLAICLRDRRVRQWRQARRLDKKRRERREARELRLEQAGAPQRDLPELTELVSVVEARAPGDAAYYRLEELLDTYAELARTSHAYLCETLRAPVTVSDCTPRLQRAVRVKTVGWRRTCSDRLAMCDERLDEIAELVRLYAQRALAIEVDHVLDDELIARQVGRLAGAETIEERLS